MQGPTDHRTRKMYTHELSLFLLHVKIEISKNLKNNELEKTFDFGKKIISQKQFCAFSRTSWEILGIFQNAWNFPGISQDSISFFHYSNFHYSRKAGLCPC